jgi:pyocin large subunit-like protein
MKNSGKLDAVMAAWELEIPATEKLVLVCLVQHINPKTETAWCSVARLARLTGLCERSVQRSLARLEAVGAITRDERVGRTSEYRSHLRRTGAEPVADPRLTVTPPPTHSHPNIYRT